MNRLINFSSRYAIVAWQRRWLSLSVAWLVCLIGWGIVFLIPNNYESRARLYVDSGAVMTPLLRSIAMESGAPSDVDVLQRTLLSRANLEKLIAGTDLQSRVSSVIDREALIQSLSRSIRIIPQTRDLFAIEYADHSPKLARDVVQTIVTLFIESVRGTTRDDLQGAQAFLDRQIATYETQLREAEQARTAFQIKHAAILNNTAGSAGPRLDAAREQTDKLNGQVIDARDRRDLLKQEVASTPPLLTVDPGSRGGAAGGARASPPHFVPNPVYEQLKLRLIDAQSVLDSLTRQASEAEAQQARLSAIAQAAPGVEAEFVTLNRNYDVLRKNAEELLARREAMRLSAAVDEAANRLKLRVVDEPQIPSIPNSPKRLLLNFGVLIVGLAAGFGVVFFLVLFDRAFYSVVDLRRIGLPVLGGVSLQLQQRPMANYAGRLGFVASCLLLLLVFGGLAAYPLWRATPL